MIVPSSLRRLIPAAVFGLCLSGCAPFFDADSEEKNPLIGDGLAKKAAYNFQGALESFEKALEGNPRLARPHWELGLLYSQNVPNPAAAIYHFERLLKLRPDWRQADTARGFIDAAKIELAKSVPLGPQTPHMQQQLDKLTAQVHQTANENTRLRQQNQALQAQVAQLNAENTQLKNRLLALQSPPATGASSAAVATSPNLAAAGTRVATSASAPTQQSTARAATSKPGTQGASERIDTNFAAMQVTPGAPTSRTYTVRARDTLSGIAAARGVKLRDLIRANPSINPNRLKVGQTIKLP